MTSSSSEQLVLGVVDLSKQFGPVRALDKVNLSVKAGTVHSLVGLNGSGKSTLIKCLSGYYRPDSGRIEVDGVAVPDHAPALVRQGLGLSFMHQDLGLVDTMPIVDNVRASHYSTRLGKISWRSERARVSAALKRFGVERNVDDNVALLAPWERAVLGLIRALQPLEDSQSTGLVVLDEPTASLPDHEVGLLFSAVREVTAAGSAVLFISHRIDEVLSLSDEVSTIRDGRIVGHHIAEDLTSRTLVNLIIGRELGEMYPAINHRAGDADRPAVTVERLCGRTVRDVSLKLLAGEVVGLAGIAGAGHNEVPHLLFGSLRRTAGEIKLQGERLGVPNPRKCQSRGMVLVPADRPGQSAIQRATTRENLSVSSLRQYRRGALRFLDERAERRRSGMLVAKFDVVPRDLDTAFASLSGGNQQKVIIARVLENRPKVVLLEEPTQGVDVGAKQRIFQIIRDLAGTGAAVLYASTEFDDLAHVCDRVLVFRDGQVAAQIDSEELSKDRILEQCYAK